MIDYTNLIFYAIFLIEMLMKWLGQGVTSYFTDNQNIFDMVIVLLSTMDISLHFYNELNDLEVESFGAISQVLRISRLIRVFKLARTWRSFNYFLTTIGNTMAKISAFIVLLGLFLFMFTIVGMEMFANTLRFNYDNEPIPYFSENPEKTSLNFSYPPYNFDHISDAAVTVFVGLANDGWSTIYFDHARGSGLGQSSAFFIVLVVLGQMILFNLFLAILLKEFDEGKLLEDAKEARENSVLTSAVPWYTRVYRKCVTKKPENETTADVALCVFKRDHCLRRMALTIIGTSKDESSHFDKFILLVITVSSVALSLENPLTAPEGPVGTFLNYLDKVTTTVFLVEVVLRVVALGFVFNGPGSYLR